MCDGDVAINLRCTTRTRLTNSQDVLSRVPRLKPTGRREPSHAVDLTLEAESYCDFKTPLTSTIVARSKDETQLFESECVGRVHDRGTARG
jgi:hypothetical protein